MTAPVVIFFTVCQKEPSVCGNTLTVTRSVTTRRAVQPEESGKVNIVQLT